MARTYLFHLDTFDKIAAFYESIKPIGGIKLGGKDVRPIGARRDKHERIIKISDDCYAISDSYNEGDPIFGFTPFGGGVPDGTGLEFYAPVVWRRHPDGTETIKLRNATGSGAHQKRYSFLYYSTPRTFSVSVDNGRQYIGTPAGRYFLAKGKTTPKAVYVAAKARAATGTRMYGLAGRTVEDDNASLVFRRDGSNWTLISHGGNLVEPPRPRRVVDHEVKNAMKAQIETFREWVHIIAPMLTTDMDAMIGYGKSIAEWQTANGTPYPHTWGCFDRRVNADLARAIVVDPEHPLRTAMAAYATLEAGLTVECEDATDVTELKGRFNRWLNKALGLTKLVKE